MLKASSAAAIDWPYAMRTAQASMGALARSRLGRPAWQPLPFGTQVQVRTRSWERYGDVWSDRVQGATVLAPSVETCKGHVVRTSSGALMHTTALFRGTIQSSPRPVVDPGTVLPAHVREAPFPQDSTCFCSWQGGCLRAICGSGGFAVLPSSSIPHCLGVDCVGPHAEGPCVFASRAFGCGGVICILALRLV